MLGRVLLSLIAALTTAGCGLLRTDSSGVWHTEPVPDAPLSRLRRGPAPRYVAPEASVPARLVLRPVIDGLAARFQPGPPPETSKPINVLALCAAGVEGPYTAGAVVGWTASGTRPTFDVVTGVSSGALIALFAFLGPKYDARLQALCPNITTKDLLHFEPFRCWLRDRTLATPRPLERTLAAEITETLIADLRQAHADGRRLYIGTTNVETRRAVFWDIGAIAASEQPDAALLIRKILVASATWPGLLPAVEIEVYEKGRWRVEKHADGGTSAQTFLRFAARPDWPEPGMARAGWLSGSNLYVIAGGKLFEPETPDTPSFFGRIQSAVSCLTNSLAHSEMQHMHTFCTVSGMQFHLLSLPPEHHGPPQHLLKLDRAEMRRLFQVGYQLTSRGARWRDTPPGYEASEEPETRGN